MTEVGPATLSSPHYFLPHHAVMKEFSSTTKLRIVFDASCKTSDGTSLNDHLFIGPRLQDDIFDHISRFRKHKIAFTADINKMYRQIWVTPNDSLYQLILWRDLEGDGVKIYRLNTVTFGTASAPYLAIRTLQQLAADERDDYPIASKIALKNFYVHDVIHGADYVAEALEMQSQLITMLKHGGFPLRKCSSNCEMLLTSVPEEDREIQVPLSFREEDAIKALGIQWHPAKDIFTFKIALQDLKTTTKRSILSDLARLYDPMGWIAPCVIVGKILMQDIWKEKHTWDSELPATIVSAWHKLKMELNTLKAIEIPRWINFTKESKIEVPGFCDASEKAYAAAIYLRITTGIKIYTNLIVAKTRVAPLKNKSIASAPYIRTTFVANRVAEIQELTDPQRWNYVPSKKNPADIASRGVSPNELVENHQWWYGPAFLQGFDEQLHLLSEIKSTDLETKASEISKTKNDLIASGYPIINIFQLCVHFTCFERNQSLFERFSSLNRLYRAAAYWRRYLTNLKFKAKNITTRVSGPLSVDEISSARTRLIVYVQKEFFAEDISRLTKGDTVSKRSKLARLSPIVDEKGILRVEGRLENADLPYSQRHPIILPSQGFLTSLIVHDTHMKLLHGGQQLMMAILCTEYWILHLKSTVKKCIHKFLKCYRFTATEMQQKMGNLPALRVNQARPFQTSGVDYAGPVLLKAWRGRCSKITKAYIAIFICFCTKAVHLELVSDYATSAFLAAFKRFTARRGICTNLYSDCGTNFKGAATVLESERSHMSKQWTEDIVQRMEANGTNWHFNPPAAPHFGGLWEAGVKSMKYHLKRIIGHYTLTFEEYATILAQDLTEIKDNYLDRWQLMQKIQQNIWKKWKSEYLVRLQQRPKWLKPNSELKVGHLVLLPDEQTPPTLWRLGRITEMHPGADGKVRVVTVKTATSSFKRPIAKLCILPMLNDSKTQTDTHTL
ncbi:uncharacterized protein LOC129944103 [Eupeodes corollae]|uniref:uncharacterized protein LOC129944103 n=1 Tax=Eupeodes corollae TaxID=290404 RepID=UPI00249084FC|nr:uncharacterized protein LOC129944103 [Eupeodes corollae]